jgi:hypothetical protein
MSWRGNTSNPVPSNVDETKKNPYFTNQENKAMDVRRDKDTRKNFTVTLIDIDNSLMEYLQNVINPTVVDAGANIKVPILYGNPERWKAIQNDGYYRDINGKIQLPAIMFKRSSFSKNENLQTFNRYLTYPVMTKFSEKNQYTKFSLLNDTVAPVNQIHAVTLPDHVKVEYEFMVWTEYVEQMNAILEKINFASEDYWGDPQRFKFRVTINDYSHTTEVSNDKDRMVRTSFTLSLFAYLLPESFEDRKSTVQKLLTPKKISITAEIVNGVEMTSTNKNVKANSYSNPSNPYYNVNNVISSIKDSWTVPKPAIVTEKSTVEGGDVTTQIRQSYAALIQQTINMVISGSTTGSVNIWHNPPSSPTEYGEEGWMAYDGDYHYIYVGGRWRRQAIADFE